MPKKRKISPIGGVLAQLFERRSWRRRIGLHQVFRFWDKAVGREIANQAKPSLIRGDVLWVNVSDSVWMQQLHLQKIIMLEKINERLGEDKLVDIRFQVNVEMSLEAKVVKQDKQQVGISVDPKQQAEFDGLSACLPEGEVRDSLRHMWLKFHRHSPPSATSKSPKGK